MSERTENLQDLEQRARLYWGLVSPKAVAESIYNDRAWVTELLREGPAVPESLWGALDQLDQNIDDIDGKARELGEEQAETADDLIRSCRQLTRWTDEIRDTLEEGEER